MSFRRRILDGVNTLMDKVAADDTPLSHVDEGELQAELEARKAVHKAAPRAPADNPLARAAGGSEEALRHRRQVAEKRSARVGSARSARAQAEHAARERAFRAAKEQAAAGARRPPRSSGTSAGAGSGSRQRSTRSPLGRKDPKIAHYYKVLNLPYGADFDQVKKAYRGLVRKYHPDRHVGQPQKQKAATELTMRVTQAYNELETYLTGGRHK